MMCVWIISSTVRPAFYVSDSLNSEVLSQVQKETENSVMCILFSPAFSGCRNFLELYQYNSAIVKLLYLLSACFDDADMISPFVRITPSYRYASLFKRS